MTGRRGPWAAVFVLISATTVAGQTFVATGRDTLRGLPGIEVIVDTVPPELQRAGVAAADLVADVAGRLRKAGITVYANQKENASVAKPFLYVHLNALQLPNALAVVVQVDLRQTVRSTDSRLNIVNAMTWEVHDVVSLQPAEVPLLRQVIGEMVGRFVSDWRSVH